MDRGLWVEVDQASWPAVGPPDYPAAFPTFNAEEPFNIPTMLLAIGVLTTPSFTSGVSLSEYWAWVRYLHAIAETDDLRLTRGFWDLDAHQKTILSDDFGMGAPMLWLLDRLQLREVCDGRYFIERLATTTGAVAARTAKRGPNKAPDFVFRDVHGVWHVLECKGTQSGEAYRTRQIGDVGPPPTGARAQKRVLTFPPGHTGQRLISALTLSVEEGPERSTLKILDPPGDEEFRVDTNQLVYASDAATRATVAKALRLAGFGAASVAMSAPSGFRPTSRPLKGRAEARRKAVVQEKTWRAEEELRAAPQRETFTADREKYRGRKVEFELPASVHVGGRETRHVRLRQGINVAALRELARQPLVEDPLETSDSAWRESLGQIKAGHDRRSARLQIGDFFVSEVEFRS
jgi:hypothetical protein